MYMSIEVADTTVSCNISLESMFRCENPYATGILFVNGLLCRLRFADLVRRERKDILGPKSFFTIL